MTENNAAPQLEERLRRMQETFSEDRSILVEDYEFFAGEINEDAPILQNTDSRMSAAASEQQALEPN